jgi:protein-S-isoprenylcysteine O-methyltransferase Ste14
MGVAWGRSNPMLVSLLRWIAFAASLSIPLVYFRGGTVILKDAKRSVTTTGGYLYLVFTIVISLAGLAILATQLLLCLGVVRTSAWAERWWLVVLGTSVTVTSISVSYWFRFRYLGRFWSGTVELRENHEIVEDGPYRIVRHPLYAMALVIYPGIALAFAVWWNWIACGIMVIGYIWLAAYEDAFLAANLSGYREYQQRTPYRLAPGIW